MRGGASKMHDALVANSVFTLRILCTLAQNQLDPANSPPYLFEDEPLLYYKKQTMLESLFGTALRPLLADEWGAVFREAGFTEVASAGYKICLLEQFRSHLQVDGIRRYFSALYSGMANPTVRLAFFNKDVFQAAQRFSSYVGYGLYTGRKAGE